MLKRQFMVLLILVSIILLGGSQIVIAQTPTTDRPPDRVIFAPDNPAKKMKIWLKKDAQGKPYELVKVEGDNYRGYISDLKFKVHGKTFTLSNLAAGNEIILKTEPASPGCHMYLFMNQYFLV